MYNITFFAPPEFVEAIKNALFAAGAGKICEYEHCAWQVLGEGQFIPSTHSHAYVGTKGKLEKLPEYRVEIVCDKEHLLAAIQALKATHPYETPVYHVIKTESW